MKLIAQVEQAIKGQIDETESRIVAIEDVSLLRSTYIYNSC